MKSKTIPQSFMTSRCATRGAAIECAAPSGLRGGATASQPLSIAGKKAMPNTIHLLLVTVFLTGLLYPAASFAALPSLSGATVYWTTAGKVSSVKDTTAKLGATIDSNGGEAISERGVVWSASDNTPEIGEPGVTKIAEGGTAVGIFSASIAGLPKASRISFQGYATNTSGSSYSGVSSFYTEPDPVAVTSITDSSYFELTVNFPIPDTSAADGVVVVVRQQNALATPPYDGTVHTANSRIGLADTTNPSCLFYCEAVVASEPAISGGSTGSVTVTGLKDGFTYSAAVFTYKGTGSGITGINYNQTISSTSAGTASPGHISHNEIYVAGTKNGDGTWTPAPETNEGCAYCHGAHHTSQLLPTQLDMANKCFTCHSATGSAAAKADVAMHLADGRVDCGTCHSLHSFRKEELYSTNNRTNPPTKGFNKAFVRANMSKYINPTDYPPPGGGGTSTARDKTVFQNSTIFKFATPDPPTGYYNGVCQTCHTGTRFYTQTASSSHQNSNYCINCHRHKPQAGYYNAFLRSM